MKKLYILIITAFIMQQSIIGQEDWFWQNPLPQGNHIRKIISIDENNIVAGGLNSFFIKSADGGLNWDLTYLSKNISVSDLKYFNPDNILFGVVADLVVGSTILYKSTDKGSSWDSIFTFTNLFISDIDKNSENEIFAVGQAGNIFKSNDFGYTWNTITPISDEYLNAIRFTNEQNGCIVGRNGTILRTSDNGNNWSTIPSGTTKNLYSIDFLDSLNGYTVGQQDYNLQENTILKTTDAGITWNKVLVTNPIGQLIDVKFIDSSNIIIVGGDDDYFGGREPVVIRSSDGGNSWTDISSQFSRGISSISFVNTDYAICGGFSGSIYKSEDSGLNWVNLSSGFLPYFTDLCTFNAASFFTIGKDYRSDEVILLYTDNGGKNWQLKNSPYLLNIGGIDFYDENYGMITGDDLIYFTLDGCNTWNQGTAPTGSFMDMKIISGNKAFLSGDQGILLKSTDGGNNWFSVNSNTTGNLERIVFRDSLNGLIIANPGPSIITTDGGESWSAINYTFDWLNDGTFFGSDNIALSGSSGKIYISNDGGQTWIEKIVAGSGTYISSIAFKNSLNGTAVGETGLIVYTTDGGDTWNQQFSPTLIDLTDIEYSKEDSAVIIGKDGVILGTKKGILIVGVDDKHITHLLNEFYLLQNYPNPFNPSTKIRWQLPVGSWQTLKIYDMLGNEIATLVNEYKPAGTYEVEWDASSLPSGVYFYQLKTNEFIETKKMILMK